MKASKYLLLKTKPAEFPAALAAWRNTDKEDKPSPNELMFCRKVRDGKAILKSQLYIKTPEKLCQQIPHSVINDPDLDITPEIQASDTTTQSLSQRQNPPPQPIPEQYQQGESIRIQDPHTKRWDVTALITSFSKTGQTVELYTEEGHFLRRNRRFIRRKCAA